MSAEDNAIVIVGAGQAGTQAAASLRDFGFVGRIVLVGEEPDLPYQRPPLSKAYLKGEATQFPLRAERFFAEKNIELLGGERAEAILRKEHRVRFSSGREEPYGHLILALGGVNRRFPGNADGILMLRTHADADRIRSRINTGKKVVIIGAGFVGLEMAASIRSLGLDVTVVDIAPRPLARAASVATSEFFRSLHEANDVPVYCGIESVGYRPLPDGKFEVRFGDRAIVADLVLAGIGIEPNTSLASDAGLETRNGVIVDQYLSTADPMISAIGDCAAFYSESRGEHIRIESVQNAIDQAKTVAARIIGKKAPYHAVPWFWSDQYQVKLQIAGLTAGHDDVAVVGDIAAQKFSVFCFKDGRCVAVESINAPADHMAARKLLASHAVLKKEDLTENFSLKDFLANFSQN